MIPATVYTNPLTGSFPQIPRAFCFLSKLAFPLFLYDWFDLFQQILSLKKYLEVKFNSVCLTVFTTFKSPGLMATRFYCILKQPSCVNPATADFTAFRILSNRLLETRK